MPLRCLARFCSHLACMLHHILTSKPVQISPREPNHPPLELSPHLMPLDLHARHQHCPGHPHTHLPLSHLWHIDHLPKVASPGYQFCDHVAKLSHQTLLRDSASRNIEV